MLSFFKKIFHIIIVGIEFCLKFIKEKVLTFGPIAWLVELIIDIVTSRFFLWLCAFLEKWSFIFHIPLSLSVCFAMEWLSRHSFSEALVFVQDHTTVFLYNSYVIFAIYLLCYIVRRRALLRLSITLIFIALGIINCVVLLNRVSPFGFTDLSMIGDLLTMQNTQYFTSGQARMVGIILIIIFILLGIIYARGPKVISKYKFPLRALVLVVGIASLPLFTKQLQTKGVLAAYFGNLAQGYSDYGYLYGFNMSIFSRGVQKPLLYSKDNVVELINSTDAGNSEVSGESGPNVIVILLESFYDPTQTKFVETSTDPVPYYRSLTEDFSTGVLTVPVVGAGTCNSEFEVLTGMSCQFFGPGEYPQKTILKEIDSCESIAHVMKKLGFGTHVVHNNGGNFYSRRNAFSLMGFDTFTSKEMLDITEWNPMGSWPMDDILIDATKDALDSTSQRDFVYTITVQTHGDYPTEKVFSYPSVQVNLVDKTEEEQNKWEYYINILKQEDNFIRRYINMLQEREEPTLVIMFGDHLPTLGITSADQASGDLFQTGYATWNNFGMEKIDKDLTTYQLVSEYLNRLGIHGGHVVDYNQTMTSAGVPASSIRYLNGIHTLQYDLLYGKRYAYSEDEEFLASDIEMGVKKIKINRVYGFNKQLHIYGENFTQWSTVYVDDTPVSTTYRSGELLTINMDKIPEEGAIITVCQMGSGNTIFKSSNGYFYRVLD